MTPPTPPKNTTIESNNATLRENVRTLEAAVRELQAAVFAHHEQQEEPRRIVTYANTPGTPGKWRQVSERAAIDRSGFFTILSKMTEEQVREFNEDNSGEDLPTTNEDNEQSLS